MGPTTAVKLTLVRVKNSWRFALLRVGGENVHGADIHTNIACIACVLVENDRISHGSTSLFQQVKEKDVALLRSFIKVRRFGVGFFDGFKLDDLVGPCQCCSTP
jgi:hypothetical protein